MLKTTTLPQAKIVIICFLAGCLEIYDFTIFGFLAEVLNKNYFVGLDNYSTLIVTYGLFAVGFLFRPLGSIIFGYIGDKFGRKKALVLSVSLMGTASLGMTILPTYQVIGELSCYIMVMLRILQGISVGGEYSGAIIFAVEHFDKKLRGLIGSLVVSGCMSGVLLATLVSSVLKWSYLPTYSWRIAFLLGFILSLIGFFIRRNLQETPEFKKIHQETNNMSFLHGIIASWRECIVTIFIAATSGVNIYFISIYLPRYIKDIISIDTSGFASISTAIMVILIPVFGFVSDKVGRIKLMAIGAISLSIYTFIMLSILSSTTNYTVVLSMVIIYAAIASIFCGPMNTFIIEIFSPEKRYSCSAFSYSVGMGLIGGTTPMVSTIIVKFFGNDPTFLSGYISFISFCTFGVLISFYIMGIKSQKYV